MTLAKRAEAYIRGLEIGQGRLAGQPFDLHPWQRKFLRGALADGVGSAALSLARGGGKTCLLAGLAAAFVNGPLRRPRAEVVIVASSLSQARIAFEHCRQFLISAGEDLDDRKVWRVSDTVNHAKLTHRESGAAVRCIGSDPKRAHGLAPALILADELAQWPPTTIEPMLAALRTSLGKIPDSRLVLIGTRPGDAMHPFAAALRDSDYVQVHAAPEAAPPFQRRTWKRANPGLDAMPDLEAAIRREARAARRDPALLASFKALRLNQGVSDTEAQTLLDPGLWQAIEGEAEALPAPVWGVDLGGSAAQSAVAAYSQASGRLDALAAFAADPDLRERGRLDGAGSLYLECARRGELLTLGGRAVDIAGLLREARRRFGAPSRIACDRWRLAELHDAAKAAGLPVVQVEARGQGFQDGGEDVRMFRRACAEGKVTPATSLLLRSAMSEARTVSDPAGNSKLAKNVEGGRRKRARDDAAAAAILAVSAGQRHPKAPARAWRYRRTA